MFCTALNAARRSAVPVNSKPTSCIDRVNVAINSSLPPGGASVNSDLTQGILSLSASVFTIGLQIGAPLIVALFLANMIIGLLARTVPQIQVFVVGFPLTLLLGFIFIMFGVPFFVRAVRRMFEMLDNQLLDMIKLLGIN